jgi:hypothetical protein
VDPGVVITLSGSIATISWNAATGATSSDVLRGLAGALPVGPGGGDETCLGGNIAGTSIMDSATPPIGAAFWYLVRGKSFCGEGPYGDEIQGAQPPIPRVTTTCP